MDREKDPQRCRDLRNAERTILGEMDKVNAQNRQKWITIERQRAELRRLREKAEELQDQLTAGLAGSAMRGPAGLAMGASLTKIEVQKELIRQDIGRLEDQLEQLEREVRELQRDHDRSQDSLQDNAQQMRSLACVV